MAKTELKAYLLELLKANPTQSFNYKQILARLGMPDVHKGTIERNLRSLKAEKQVEEVSTGKFRFLKAPMEPKTIVGVIEVTQDGNGYVVSDEMPGNDVFIPSENLNTALNKDQVVCKIIGAKGRKEKLWGKIVSISERHRTEFTGLLQVSAKHAFFLPDDKKMYADIFIPKNLLNGGKDGEKALVRITEWKKTDENPKGEVIKVFGMPGLHETEMMSIMAEFDLEEEFPEEALRELAAVDDKISNEEIKRRRDFRDTLTFTIDPDDAKDFDDALSYKQLPSGNLEIGIHIADVTHYIQPDTALDKAAAMRATSVYLVDRVIPMLPEKLSNELCSLRANEDKLTFSAVFEMDQEGHIHNSWFGKTIIHSNRRFTYDEVQNILEAGDGLFVKELTTLNNIAKKIKARRFKDGAINFETDEVKIRLDEKGTPIGVEAKIRKDAHKLIEEFMLLANRKVAELLNTAKPPLHAVNRVHDHPDSERLSDFSKFAARFGYKIVTDDEKMISKSINKMIEEVEGKPEQHILNHFAIRSMPKAYYSNKKSGHYGLSFDYYTHFTSPIRRYPDMLVHRQVFALLNKLPAASQVVYEKLCKHSSEMEVTAAEAERTSVKMKQCEYLMQFIGKQFEAIISGTTEWGIYAEIVENKCEGMIRLSNITDDYYSYDEANYQVVGRRYQKKFKIGDRVQIKVMRSDPLKKQADFILVDDKVKGN